MRVSMCHLCKFSCVTKVDAIRRIVRPKLVQRTMLSCIGHQFQLSDIQQPLMIYAVQRIESVLDTIDD